VTGPTGGPGSQSRLAGPLGDDAGPTFAEPWQAEAFATVQALIDADVVTPKEWMDALAAAIAEHRQGGDPDLGDTYYEHWLAALERVLAAKDLVTPDATDARAEDWRRAYLNTPHGQPVDLEAAWRS
jgi:nitrile hydratase accessory protein